MKLTLAEQWRKATAEGNTELAEVLEVAMDAEDPTDADELVQAKADLEHIKTEASRLISDMEALIENFKQSTE